MVDRVYNFSPGPATLPVDVLQQASKDVVNFKETGIGLIEMSHRSKEFMEVAENTESLLRELMKIPDNYKVLFLQGGASSQFFMIPMNLLGNQKKATYLNTGVWSKKAIKEAEAYPGPSLIIAYSPCIAHGLRKGMAKVMDEEKFAVEAGYWNLYRYNPLLELEGKNPFQLDSKEPDFSKYKEFLDMEVRFTTLKKTFPERAKELQEHSLKNMQWRYNFYKRMAEMDYSEK